MRSLLDSSGINHLQRKRIRVCSTAFVGHNENFVGRRAGILLGVSFEAAGGVIDSTDCAKTLVGDSAIVEMSVVDRLFADPAIAAKAAIVCVSAR